MIATDYCFFVVLFTVMYKELLPFVDKIHKCGRRTKKNMNKTATTTTTITKTTTTTTKPQKNRRVSENKR